MKIIDNKELIKTLKRYRNKGIYIHHLGTISATNTIHKMTFVYYNNIIVINDKISKNYFAINLSYVYKMLTNRDRTTVKLFLDDDVVITIVKWGLERSGNSKGKNKNCYII